MITLVLVSHSARLADGLAEVAAQMAPDVPIVAVGGTSDGGIGTDFDRTLAAVPDEGEVLLLVDLGSAAMTAELVVETLDEPRVRMVNGPFVEGTVAAAVAAQSGASFDDVARAAAGEEAAVEAAPTESDAGSPDVTVRLTNELGLHARPAAQVAKAVAALDASVDIAHGDKHANGSSVLALMGLGAGSGAELRIQATGPDATRAVAVIRELAESSFGE